MARKSVRKSGSKIPQHRKYSKPAKPVTDADMAFVEAALGVAAAEGHAAPPPEKKLTRTVKPIDPGLLGRGKTTKAAAAQRKAEAKAEAKGKVKEPAAEPAAPNGTEATPLGEKAERCSVCGKPLTKDSSQAQGMGDICAGKHAQLPAGMDMHEYKQSLSKDEIPDGWVKLRNVYFKARAMGISKGKFLRAVGGDRHLVPPMDPAFKVVYVKGVRYMPPESIKALSKVKALK